MFKRPRGLSSQVATRDERELISCPSRSQVISKGAVLVIWNAELWNDWSDISQWPSMDSHHVGWRKLWSAGLATKNCHPEQRERSQPNHILEPGVGTLDGFGPVRRNTRITALVKVLPFY